MFKRMDNQLVKYEEKGEIVLYHEDDSVRLEVMLQNETVWLTQQQMAELFQVGLRTVAGPQNLAGLRRLNAQRADTCRRLAKK